IVKDANGTYFVDIFDHRLKDSTSPIDLVEPQIRAIIINQRKLKLVERLREELYNNALANKDVRFP
ncbi:MAG: peptidyl-prolyl cis-trans isomerase, partial [Bacteroidetes bacterium]|nr:peptidyl-prolyl cis-trans isomerase [Bacteroidota bacterium]